MNQADVKVSFYLKKSEADAKGNCPVMARLNVGKYSEDAFSVKMSVPHTIWHSGRATGKSVAAREINRQLDEIRAIDELTKEITEHYNHIKKSLGFVTAELVKNAVKGIGQKPVTLLALFREHNEEFKKRVGVDRIKETYDCYQRSYKHLAAFIQEKRGVEDVTLRSLDKVFYDDFEIFLQSDCRLSPKTVHEHLYRLKKMTMRAVSQGTLRRDPYCRLHPPLPKRKSRHMKLEDLKILMSTPLPLTMYVVRHSWASIARDEGIPISVISEGIGHDSESTTQIYLASLETQVIDKANKKY